MFTLPSSPCKLESQWFGITLIATPFITLYSASPLAKLFTVYLSV